MRLILKQMDGVQYSFTQFCRTYFRYFKVDLLRPCPFWPDDGECEKEDCAVCECDPNEVPACWEQPEATSGAGSSGESSDADEATDPKVAQLSKVHGGSTHGLQGWGLEEGAGLHSSPSNEHGGHAAQGTSSAATSGFSRYDEANVWSVQASMPSSTRKEGVQGEGTTMQYVNLLDNPEGYTGYSGPKATRIWSAIYGENCFSGPLEGMCLEERVFYRLISGLQTSINTHIAMTAGNGEGTHGWDIYTATATSPSTASHATGSLSKLQAAVSGAVAELSHAVLNGLSVAKGWGPLPQAQDAYSPGKAGGVVSAGKGKGQVQSAQVHSLVLSPGLKPNVTLYHDRIGSHPDRLKNLYFAFLFVVRAVAKAQPLLDSLDFNTGNATEDTFTKASIKRLLSVEVPSVLAGFDESRMFKVSTQEFLSGSPTGPGAGTCPPVLHGLGDVHDLQHRYLAHVEHKAALRNAFRDKYRNISRIMDCVGCEKCRLWGKLQFLGLGTAMKILFADADSSATASAGPYAAAAGETGTGGLHISRNEVVALVNVLHRLSMSLAALQVMHDLEAREKVSGLAWTIGQYAGSAVCALVVLWYARSTTRTGKQDNGR